MSSGINIVNRRASFDFSFIEKYIAGMQLSGTEIKSIRMGKANLSDSYCFFQKEELYIRNMHISIYEQGTYNNHDPLRERKLLLNKSELKKLQKALKDESMTIVPTRLFINDKGLAKLEIALAKGKKTFDKREDIKKKDMQRESDRRFK